MRFLLVLALQTSLAGCASLSYDFKTELADRQSFELAETPFFPQERYQCGPAALATLLSANGISIRPDELAPTVFTPGRRGSLQQDLIGATRAAGLLPYQIDGDLDALLQQVEAGRPVLVLQNLGIGWSPQWHYAVVVGYDREAGRIILRSGTEKRRLTRLDAFFNTWARGDFWGLIALSPEQIPGLLEQQRYFQAVAAIEAIGKSDTALRFWSTAANHWPDHPLPTLGKGNAQLALGHYQLAATLFRTLLSAEQYRSVATNNLAFSIAQLGRFEEAFALLDAEIAAPQDERLLRTLRDTRQELVLLQQTNMDREN